MSMLEIYFLVTILPNLYIAAGISGIANTVLFALCVICYLANGPDYKGHNTEYDKSLQLSCKKVGKATLLVIIACSAIRVVIPTDKQLAIIVAGAYVTQMKGVQDIPPQVSALINSYVQDALDQIKSETVKKVATP